jgi:hypothetical protein
LFATVIRILLPQYAKIDSTGLLRFTVEGAILGEEGAWMRVTGMYSGGAAKLSPNSAAKLSFSFFSKCEDHSACGDVVELEGRDRGDGFSHGRLGPSVLETPTKVVVVGERVRAALRWVERRMEDEVEVQYGRVNV